MEWLTNLFSKKQASGQVAKDRLKLVLIHDRANTSTDLLEAMKHDILEVIKKYMDFDENNDLDIRVSTTVTDDNEAVPVLYANIPIKNMKRKTK